MHPVAAAAIALSLLLAACGGGDPTVADGAAPPDLVATLGGDAQLEGGCAWLDPVPGEPAPDDADRYTPMWPEGYSVEFEPTRLLGPDGETVAEEGDTLQLEGAVAEELATTCMTGPVFTVERILDAG